MSDFRSPHNLRPKLSFFRAGHVFLMQPGATWLNQDKTRPFVLASSCSGSQAGVLAYGSTRATETASGAVAIEVPPRSSGVNANGLTERTFFYPGVLFQVDYGQLPPYRGSLGFLLAEFKRSLTQALGIGTGNCLRPGVPWGSLRGRIVRLERETALDLRSAYAVLLTQHAYSRQKRYQLLIPLFRTDLFAPSEPRLRVFAKEWSRVFRDPATDVIVPVHLIQSVWHSADIVAETPYVIDEETLHRIEAELCARFELGEQSGP